jgi:cytochrome P450
LLTSQIRSPTRLRRKAEITLTDAPGGPAGPACEDLCMTAARMPPGPPIPRALQTIAFMFGGWRFLELCHRRYGGAVSLRTLFDRGFVMVFDPELVRQLFQGPHDQLNAGEANALLGPILGEHSVLVLDGGEHMRHRRLMLAPFHGARLAAYEQAVREAADAEIDSWPVGRPFSLQRSMQSLTLRVIVGPVFGFGSGPRERELRARLAAMIEPVAAPRGMLTTFLGPRVGLEGPRRRFERARAAVDELIFEEIAARRALAPGELAGREDAFSALLAAREQDGRALSDREVRDELVTLLVAGHETTATGLAWTLDLLLHDRRALERARRLEPAYLDAVVKEALRLRPVIPGVGRVVRGEPFRLGGWVIPEGIEIDPSIRIIHRSPELYHEPDRFRPERFLGPDAPDTYTWLPFGGGTRRCLGASFAQMEMRVALARILERTSLRAFARRHERAQFRAITLAPRRGVRAVLEREPLPGARARAKPAPEASAQVDERLRFGP